MTARGICAAIFRAHFLQRRLGQQIGLVEQDQIGAEQLILVDFLQRIVVVERRVLRALGFELFLIVGEAAFRNGGGVHHRDHPVHRQPGADVRPVEGLDEGLWQREARGFDQYVIGARLARQQALDGGQKIVGDGAAQAAIGQLDNIVFGAGLDAATPQDLAIDADIAKFIDDQREAAPLRMGQHMTDERGLARAEKAGDDGDGDFGESGHACAPVAARGETFAIRRGLESRAEP